MRGLTEISDKWRRAAFPPPWWLLVASGAYTQVSITVPIYSVL